MSDYILVSYYEDFRRMGSLNGMFICTKKDLESLEGKEIYYGEVLGKHSEVFCTIDGSEFTIKDVSDSDMEALVRVFGVGTLSGYSPFDYLDEDDEDYEDEDYDE